MTSYVEKTLCGKLVWVNCEESPYSGTQKSENSHLSVKLWVEVVSEVDLPIAQSVRLLLVEVAQQLPSSLLY